MKEKLLLFKILSILLFSSCNLSNNKSHLQDYGLNGNVKSTKVSSFSAQEKFGEPSKIELYSDNSESVHFEFKFNEKGNIEEENLFNESEYLTKKYKYLYNNDEKISSISEYNSDGKLIGKSMFEYSNNGEKKTVQHLNQNDEIKYFQKIVLDKNGNKIKSSIYDSAGKLIVVNKDEYENNNRIKSKTYNENGALDYFWTYQHDDFGNEIIEKSYNNKDILEDKIEYQYEYDSYNNWINKTKFLNDTLTMIFERKIQY